MLRNTAELRPVSYIANPVRGVSRVLRPCNRRERRPAGHEHRAVVPHLLARTQ